jgi:predicted nucleic acid-binding protein
MIPTTPTPDARYVFDTNVLISALLFTNSTPDQAFAYALEHGSVLISLPLLQELRRVLGRSKFDRYVTQAERDQFIALLTLNRLTHPGQKRLIATAQRSCSQLPEQMQHDLEWLLAAAIPEKWPSLLSTVDTVLDRLDALLEQDDALTP